MAYRLPVAISGLLITVDGERRRGSVRELLSHCRMLGRKAEHSALLLSRHMAMPPGMTRAHGDMLMNLYWPEQELLYPYLDAPDADDGTPSPPSMAIAPVTQPGTRRPD